MPGPVLGLGPDGPPARGEPGDAQQRDAVQHGDAADPQVEVGDGGSDEDVGARGRQTAGDRRRPPAARLAARSRRRGAAAAPRSTSWSALRCGASSATIRNGAPGARVRSPTRRRRCASEPTTAYRSRASPNGTSARRARRRPARVARAATNRKATTSASQAAGQVLRRTRSGRPAPSTTANATAASNAGFEVGGAQPKGAAPVEPGGPGQQRPQHAGDDRGDLVPMGEVRREWQLALEPQAGRRRSRPPRLTRRR